MFQKIFFSFVGLIFLAIVVDVALICGFYTLASAISENTESTVQVILPEETKIKRETY
jgi:CHASE3 domain sensor protein